MLVKQQNQQNGTLIVYTLAYLVEVGKCPSNCSIFENKEIQLFKNIFLKFKHQVKGKNLLHI